MPGFFRKLAEQAGHPMPSLHPARARLFAPMDESNEIEPKSIHNLDTSPAVDEDTPAVAQASTEDVRRMGAHRRTPAATRETANLSIAEVNLPTRNSPGADPSPRNWRDEEQTHEEVIVTPRPSRTTPASRVTPGDLSGDRPDSDPDAVDRLGLAPEHSEPNAPTRRSALNTAPPKRRASAFQVSDARNARSRVDTIPDVHIHIGRIELVATTPAKTIRTSSQTKKPMSLDEYLDKRRKGAP